MRRYEVSVRFRYKRNTWLVQAESEREACERVALRLDAGWMIERVEDVTDQPTYTELYPANGEER